MRKRLLFAILSVVILAMALCVTAYAAGDADAAGEAAGGGGLIGSFLSGQSLQDIFKTLFITTINYFLSGIVNNAFKLVDRLMSDSTLYSMCARAFPLLIHMELCTDGTRRVTEIREVTGYEHGGLLSRPLYEFDVYDNVYEGDICTRVVGEFRQLSPPSGQLIKRLLKKGARRSELAPFLREEDSK